MPFYVFTSADGESIDEQFSMKDVPRYVKRGGKRYDRDYAAEGGASWMADHDWSGETSGKGRYISQIASRPGDPSAYCKNQREAMDKAKKKGFSVERAR